MRIALPLHLGASRRLLPGRRIGWRLGLLLAAELVVGLAVVVGLLDGNPRIRFTLIRVPLAIVLTAAMMWLTIRTAAPGRSRRTLAAAGSLGLLVGIVGLAAGAIVGLAGLLITGVSLLVAFGLLILVSSGILTVAATAWLLRSVSRWWRLLGIPVAYLVFQFWLLPVTMAVLGTHAPRAAFTATPPAGAARVTFSIPGGPQLAGWYTPSKNGAAVIVLPGAGGTKADTTGQAAVLAKHGYGVLAVDMRGTGESQGQSMLWGWGGDLDVEAAYAFLTSQPAIDANRIGVLGLSMGGEVAITSMADPRIRAAVAEGATARTCADLTFLGSDMEGTIHRADSCLGWFLAGLIQREPEPVPLATAIARAPNRSFLLIAADLPEEHDATEAWRALSPQTIELWEPAGAGHTGALAADPAGWERRVIDFFDRTLR